MTLINILEGWIDSLDEVSVYEDQRIDPHYQYHLSVEPNLIPNKTFAQQIRTVSSAGARGSSGGDGIYTTNNLQYWATQLAYENVGEFPRYVYLVYVTHPSTGSSWAPHQDVNEPQDVKILKYLGDLGDDDDVPDYGKIMWLAEKWIKQHKLRHLVKEDITLWHGGRGVESSYDEVRPHRGGRWEHGPGLYLTTHYDTAAKYAKGGGKLYKVTVKAGGTNISDVKISFEDMASFVNRYVIGRKRPEMISDLKNNMARTGGDSINAEVLVNLCLNNEAIPNTKTNVLRQFLIDHGVDYSKVSNYGGRDETVLVVINPRIIKRVEIVPASSVKDGFQLPFE